jgi:hypothetical protein
MVNICTFRLEKVILGISSLMLNVIAPLIIDAIISVYWRANSLGVCTARQFLLVPHIILNLIRWVISDVNCLMRLRIIISLIRVSIWIIQKSIVVYHTSSHYYVAVSLRRVAIWTSTITGCRWSIVVVRHYIYCIKIILLNMIIDDLIVLISIWTTCLSARWCCIFPLVEVNSIIFRWRHSVSISWKWSAFAIISLVSGCMSLRMHTNSTHLLIYAIGLKLRNERTLLFATDTIADTDNFINCHLISPHVVK